ncbi:hypothetical protein QQF64_005835 [Cirrhinus molitorella]|uniref:Uncharacterized protein n=1 Tax=Cirrhinus molitorella TaxID=172907 RepID=A0ABR3MFN2_9TELE
MRDVSQFNQRGLKSSVTADTSTAIPNICNAAVHSTHPNHSSHSSPTLPPLKSEHFKPCQEKDLAYCLNDGECFVIETLSGPHKHCSVETVSLYRYGNTAAIPPVSVPPHGAETRVETSRSPLPISLQLKGHVYTAKGLWSERTVGREQDQSQRAVVGSFDRDQPFSKAHFSE